MPEKAIFLDRDDTLVEDPGYINHPDQIRLLDGVSESLAQFKQMGYKLILVSNQSAVARGIVTEVVLSKINDRLQQLLSEGNAALDAIYYCPYHPDAVVRKYRKESNWRKPAPGMLLAAAKEHDIDTSQSWAIGNSDCDIEAGKRAGCRTILVDDFKHSRKIESTATPDYRAINIKEAVNIIKKHHRLNGKGEIEEMPDIITDTKIETTDEIKTDTAFENSQPVMETMEKDSETKELLGDILEQLRRNQRTEMFSDFSIMRWMSGLAQVIALFCLLICIWFLLSPTKQIDSILISLGFTLVFQIMALTFFTMHGHK